MNAGIPSPEFPQIRTDDPQAQQIMAAVREKEIKRNIDGANFIMGDSRGRYTIAWLLEALNLYGPVFNTNAMEMGRKCGKQESAQLLKDLILRTVGHEAWSKMEKEQIDTKLKDQQNARVELEILEKKRINDMNRKVLSHSAQPPK